MGRLSGRLAVAVVAVTAAVLLSGCSQGFASEAAGAPSGGAVTSTGGPTNGEMQSHDGGKVTIEVRWLGLDGDRLSFEVAMNTHSVDLDVFDLGQLAVLHDDTGREYRPASWESAPGGHHRRGTLAFAGMDSLVNGETDTLEMTISDIAGVPERVLTWNLR